MSARVSLRDDLAALTGYHSPQVPAEVRLNTNESPFPPPPAWQAELASLLAREDLHRYPDRGATALREGVAGLHGVDPEEVFCANGSNEVLQSLCLAFGGAGRRAVVFEPTYALHSHIARVTATGVVEGGRTADHLIDLDDAGALLAEVEPAITFVCSPNNPTGRLEHPHVVGSLVERAPGLVVVDEAYGQFADWSAVSLRHAEGSEGLVVVRTFSKTWAMAGVRLGYLVAHPDVVSGCEAVALPYHLSTPTQLAGTTALHYEAEMEERVARVTAARRGLAAGLAELAVETWPSQASFILFRPLRHDARSVWQALLDGGVLIRDCSGWSHLEGCLRVTVGTEEENERFLTLLAKALT